MLLYFNCICLKEHSTDLALLFNKVIGSTMDNYKKGSKQPELLSFITVYYISFLSKPGTYITHNAARAPLRDSAV